MTKRKPKELLKTRRYELSEDQMTEFLRLYKEGLSIKQISIKMDIGYWTLRDRFQKAGYKIRNRTEAYELAHAQGRIGGTNRGKFKENSHGWKGGRTVDGYGYAHIKMPEHPRATMNGYVREHLVVWETANGKPLPDGWHIHHINGIKSDNRLENLLALPSREHSKIIPLLSDRIRELEEENKNLKEKLKNACGLVE